MKISYALICSLLLAIVAGCAHDPARGGTADSSMSNTPQITGGGSSEQPDYQEILSDPGWF